MQVLLFIMAFTNIVFIVFFALRYIARTIHERKAPRDYTQSIDYSHSAERDLQLSL